MSCKHTISVINVFFVIITLNLMDLIRADNFRCYTCTYTRSADPTVGYECITSVGMVYQVDCEPPNVCKTVTLFQTNMTDIRSVTRNCLPRGSNCVGDICCNTAGAYPLCEEKCEQSLCNNINPETWLTPGQGQTTTLPETWLTPGQDQTTTLPETWLTPGQGQTTTLPNEVTDSSHENNTGTSSQDSVTNITVPAHLFDVNASCYTDTVGVYNLISVFCILRLVLYFGQVG